jgi:YHS domain-containing protein
MYKLHHAWMATAFMAVGTISLVGCSSNSASTAPTAATESTPTATTTAKMPEGFDKLSPADQTAALAQKVCPVSGEKLGEMGTPFKVTVKGRDVFLCCPNCKDDLMKDPDKYLAKLDAK